MLFANIPPVPTSIVERLNLLFLNSFATTPSSVSVSVPQTYSLTSFRSSETVFSTSVFASAVEPALAATRK